MGKRTRFVEIDGSVGEGGGQILRMAVALSCLTGTPVRVSKIRGKRHKTGLKNQHVAAIECLARFASAASEGLYHGSSTLSFTPSCHPTGLLSRSIDISAGSNDASTSLVLQAVLPFLAFAAPEGSAPLPHDGSEVSADSAAPEQDKSAGLLPLIPVTLRIHGGTNVSFSPSFDYVDQILLPALDDHFGLKVERKLIQRGWSGGKGCVEYIVHPLPPGQKLRLRHFDSPSAPVGENAIDNVDITLLVPANLVQSLQTHLADDIASCLPQASINFRQVEDSSQDSRVYILLVAHSTTGRLWGRDILTSARAKKQASGRPKPAKRKASSHNSSSRHGDEESDFAQRVSHQITQELFQEVSRRGVNTCDEWLQDQLLVYQALAQGSSTVSRDDEDDSAGAGAAAGNQPVGVGEQLCQLDLGESGPFRHKRPDKKIYEPFGQGTLHARTARWVISEMLPGVKWYENGTTCEGVGLSFDPALDR